MKKQFFTLFLGILLTSTILAAESGDVAPVCNVTDFTTQEPININDYKGKGNRSRELFHEFIKEEIKTTPLSPARAELQ